MKDKDRLCANCGHIKAQHGKPYLHDKRVCMGWKKNGRASHYWCDCKEFVDIDPQDIGQRWSPYP